MLAGDGHRVYSFALEKAELPAGGAEGRVHPRLHIRRGLRNSAVPRGEGRLPARPFAAETHRMTEVCGALWPGQILCAGKLSDAAAACAMEAGAQVEDIMLRQDFAVGNAAITAEGGARPVISGSDKRSGGEKPHPRLGGA